MSFLAPAAFGLAALLPVIVAMYLLKLRRSEQVVSSVYLWRRMVRDVEANAPWQRLRRNLLLLLQLLFLAALILALARPFTWREGAGGQAAILILDVSASMAATDLAPNRLEAAKEQAIRLLDGLPEGARLTLITAGQGAQVLVASSQDLRQVRQTLDGLRISTGEGDLSSALQLASAIAARQPETEVIVLSDGRARLPERMALKGRVRYLPIGVHGENLAISLLSLEPGSGAGNPSAFVQVTNYGESMAGTRLELYADGALFNAYDLELPPGGQRAVLVEDLPPETAAVEARLVGQSCLQPPPGQSCAADALPLDDRAWAVQRSLHPAAVTLVTEGNRFLETGLALLPNLEVTTLTPQDYASSPAGEAASLTIFDAWSPGSESLPASSLLFIAPPASTPLFSVAGALANPIPRPVDPADPLLAHVSLSGVNVLDAARIPLPGWARPVIAGDAPAGEASGEASAPLLFVGETGGQRTAVLAFDLRRSDLPLQVAFPLLLTNLTGWLLPEGGCLAPAPGAEAEESDGPAAPCQPAGALPSQAAPGEVLRFSLPLGAVGAALTRPDGSTVRLEAQGGQLVLESLEQLGLYRLEWGAGNGADFAVNLFLPQESQIRPEDSLPVAGVERGAGQLPQRARQEWWRWLAFFALILLAAEWLVYNRAALARLFAGLRRAAPGTRA